MSKKNQILYVVAGVLAAVLIILVICFAVGNTRSERQAEIDSRVPFSGEEPDVAQIEPAKLPDKNELEKAGLENVIQTDKLNEQFVLADHEIQDNSVIYYFQAAAVTNGERLTVTAKAEDLEEYEAGIPVNDRITKIDVGEYEMTFYNRMVYFVKDESADIPSVISENIDNGHAEIRYGNGSGDLVNCQSIQWYDNGISYNMESLGRSYTMEDMKKLASDYLNNRK